MGGMTVMAYADSRAEEFGTRVLGVGLLSTSAGSLAGVGLGLPSPVARAFRRAAPGVVTTLARQKVVVERIRRAGSDVGLAFTRHYSFASEVSPSLAAFVHRMLWNTPIDVVAEFLPTLDSHDKVVALDALSRVDAMVLVGEGDLMTPQSHSEEIVARLPDVELVRVPSSGHMVMLERYPEVNQQLRELIARVRAGLP
jgi:pimeloyl-ACP methyl ester carboxylesterase